MESSEALEARIPSRDQTKLSALQTVLHLFLGGGRGWGGQAGPFNKL